MDIVDQVVTPLNEFRKDSWRLINKCTKPDRKGMLFYVIGYIMIVYGDPLS